MVKYASKKKFCYYVIYLLYFAFYLQAFMYKAGNIYLDINNFHFKNIKKNF